MPRHSLRSLTLAPGDATLRPPARPAQDRLWRHSFHVAAYPSFDWRLTKLLISIRHDDHWTWHDEMAEIDAYDYELPEDLIAQHPLRHRSDARLMIVDRQAATLEHAYVRDLPEYLTAGDVLVINDSKVLPARLVGYRTATGGKWEGLFLETESSGLWRMIGKTRGALQPGEAITLVDRNAQPHTELRLLSKLDHGHWAARPLTEVSTVDLLQDVGRVPLPHYIRDGNMVDADLQRYQTVFGEHPGSVAAPTAGLHFTPELLASLESLGVIVCRVTLHVGLGTFRPISSETIDDHVMHSEWASITPSVVEQILDARAAGGRVISVGTTSMRTLESAAANGVLKAYDGQTDLFIRPPYQFQVVDGLMTNFHLPKSTLLILVRTFGGDQLIRQAYELAIEDQYRFFSYGDAMLVV